MIQKDYELVSTTKPIMTVKSIFDENLKTTTYTAEYIIIDKMLISQHKTSIFIKEKIVGTATPKDLKALIENKISILAFIEQLKNKELALWLNNKLSKPKTPQAFNLNKVLDYLPENSIYLKDMPSRSQVGLEELDLDLKKS